MTPIATNAGIKFHAESDLEIWRAEQLLTKEPETIAWLEYHAKRGGAFFDIGANIGSYTLYAAALNRELSVYSFEPVQDNYISLLRNKKLNALANINAFNIAISNMNTLTKLFIKDDRVGNSGAQLGAPTDEKGSPFNPLGIECVLSFSIDGLVDRFGFPPPTFVKIDVDGKEKEIIDGMSGMLQSPRLRSVLIEFNSHAEQEILQRRLADSGLHPDPMFNDHPMHSRHRRQLKQSSAANVVFKRPDAQA
jgi:transketolase